MDQDQSYELVDRRRDAGLVFAIAMPIMFSVLIRLLGASPTAARPRPWTDPTFAAGAVVLFVAFEAYLLWHRARARSYRLIVSKEGLSLQRSGSELWCVPWVDVFAVSLRKCTLRCSYFHEALVIEPLNGKVRVVPTASALYGRMPGIEDLLRRIAAQGAEVRYDLLPTWITR